MRDFEISQFLYLLVSFFRHILLVLISFLFIFISYYVTINTLQNYCFVLLRISNQMQLYEFLAITADKDIDYLLQYRVIRDVL